MTQTVNSAAPHENADRVWKNTRTRGGVRWGDIVLPLATFALILVVWEIVFKVTGFSELIIPRPSSIARVVWRSWALLASHAVTTTVEILMALVLATAVGILLGIGIASIPIVAKTLYPLIVLSQMIPKIALAPVILIWLGFGISSKVMLAFLIAFFPVVINTVIGLWGTQAEMIYLFQSMGATPSQMFLKLRLPGALPVIFAGIQVATTLSVIGAIVGEFLGASRGLGYLVQVSTFSLNTMQSFAAIFVLCLVGMAIFYLVERVERLFVSVRITRQLKERTGM